MEEKQINEIEIQLHEQYADNNNSYLGHIVTLVAGLFAVIAFYGNVFMDASHYFEKIEDYSYSLGDLCIVAVCAYIALGIMAYLCIYLGMHQRHEQFVVWAIRNKYYGDNYNNHYIYSEDYVRQFVGQIVLVTGTIDGDPETDEKIRRREAANMHKRRMPLTLDPFAKE